MKVSLETVVNYEQVKQQIRERLVELRDRPHRKEEPLIYHLDVAVMYPNIILTNRLQPCAIVNEADCATCAFNTECGQAAVKRREDSCQREMDWVWRGDFYPATRPEYYSIKTQREYESFPLGGVRLQLSLELFEPEAASESNAMLDVDDKGEREELRLEYWDSPMTGTSLSFRMDRLSCDLVDKSMEPVDCVFRVGVDTTKYREGGGAGARAAPLNERVAGKLAVWAPTLPIATLLLVIVSSVYSFFATKSRHRHTQARPRD
ncbi:hypothetical protein PsorP6_010307 [Peronosclerospora sorghi]|uniref:Uncharacterized protein n=1 Tax=Peronosclerospora sorghi TaxID=230839 RepID=A0ACC0VWE4_9STRA|nr:hypothetical protein PsorP6_010307 [Peronosclerospora sorghi]